MPQASGNARPGLVRWMLGLSMGLGILVVAAAGLGLVTQVGEPPDGFAPPTDPAPTGTPGDLPPDRLLGRWVDGPVALEIERSGAYSWYEDGELVETGELAVQGTSLELRPLSGDPYSVAWSLPPPYDELTLGDRTLTRR